MFCDFCPISAKFILRTVKFFAKAAQAQRQRHVSDLHLSYTKHVESIIGATFLTELSWLFNFLVFLSLPASKTNQ